MESFRSGDLVLDLLDGGPVEGDVVVLLHGFPQDATAWDEVTPYLHEAGLRTLAPHQRGYSPAARPRGASAYRLPELVGDVVALLDAAGVDRAHVVGHDWGGGVAWALAQRRPDRVSSLVVLSTPHPDAMRWAVRHADQARRSWYMLGFQLPMVPERLLARMLRRGDLRRSGLPEAPAARYAARLARASDLRGPVNWYRAVLRPARRGRRRAARSPLPSGGRWTGLVEVPTTYVWGSRDPFLGRAAAERTAQHVAGDYRFVEVPAGHWLPEREPELVAASILERAAVRRPAAG